MCHMDGWTMYLVASGFDDICGKLKNSSLSIVPELSYNKKYTH